MAIFNFVVDTKPMADSIDKVANKVDDTKIAVIAMQVAVIAAEQVAADKICRNVNLGFYSLIRSQISQKIATHKSKADAKIMEMQQQSGSLLSIKGTMEKDYMMISERYNKLFEGLNKTLRSRIFELDRPVTNFLFNDVTPAAGMSKRIVSEPSTVQRENLTLSQVIATSNSRNNAVACVRSMGGFLSFAKEQKSLVEVILTQESVWPEPEKKLPFLVVEQVGQMDRRLQDILHVPNGIPAVGSRIGSFVSARIGQFRWVDVDSWQRKRVQDHYMDRVHRSDLSERVKHTMAALLDANPWKTMMKF